MCQQALEKALKAVLAFKGAELPPIHNLRRLAEAANIVSMLNATSPPTNESGDVPPYAPRTAAPSSTSALTPCEGT